VASINSRRSVLGLFAVTFLGIGVIVLAARFGSGKASLSTTPVVWKIPTFAGQAAFSTDGRTITILGVNCEQYDTTSGRRLSSWKAPVGGRITPDGASLLEVDRGWRSPMIQVKTIRQTRTFSKGVATTHTHYALKSRTLRKGRSIKSHDTKTGAIQWSWAFPDDSPIVFSYLERISAARNQHVFVTTHEQRLPSQHSVTKVITLARHDGKVLETTVAPKDLLNYQKGTFVYQNNGDCLMQKGDSRTKGENLHLEENGQVHNFEAPVSLAPSSYFSPLIFDEKEQFLAGSSSVSQGVNSSGTLCLWNAQGQLLWNIDIAKFTPRALAFAPDGKLLAAGGSDWDAAVGAFASRLLIYDVATGKQVRELTEKTWLNQSKQTVPKAIPALRPSILNLTWSPDSKLLGAAYGGSGFKLWKVR
jgi:hypothetical protein